MPMSDYQPNAGNEDEVVQALQSRRRGAQQGQQPSLVDQWSNYQPQMTNEGNGGPISTPESNWWGRGSDVMTPQMLGSDNSGRKTLATAGTAAIPGQASGGANGGQNWGPIHDYLMQLANPNSVNIDRHDPIIRNATEAYGASQDRSRRNYLSETAESAGPMANIQAERRLSAQQAGSATAGYEAQLMEQERMARRQAMMQALGLAVNQDQFGQSLGQNAYQFDINDEFRRSPLAGGY